MVAGDIVKYSEYFLKECDYEVIVSSRFKRVGITFSGEKVTSPPSKHLPHQESVRPLESWQCRNQEFENFCAVLMQSSQLPDECAIV